MAKKNQKSKDTIVITKRSLYLSIFLVVVAIVVAIAVPAAINLKEKRKHGGGTNPDDPKTSLRQIGDDGVFFAHLEDYYDDAYYPVYREETESTEKCITVDERTPENPDSTNNYATPKCISRIRTIYGDEDEYHGYLIESVSEFSDLFGYVNSTYDRNFFDYHNLVSVVTHMDDCSNDIERVYLMKADGDDEIQYFIDYKGHCGLCADEMSIYLITVDKDVEIGEIGEAQYNDTVNVFCDEHRVDKPIIYLYPTEATDVDVKLGAPEKLTVSYPKYSDTWRVTAQPDGSLVDRTTGRSLYSLYYEADNTISKGVHDEGFVVKGSDTVSFLEEKLAQLGLNEREAEEFIVYWLPKLEANAYNYIYFDTLADISKNMPLEVSPAPETVIRVNMEFKALDAPIEVKEQQLPETPVRKGFTLVEWGGTIL